NIVAEVLAKTADLGKRTSFRAAYILGSAAAFILTGIVAAVLSFPSHRETIAPQNSPDHSIRTFRHGGCATRCPAMRAVAFSPDGRLIATGDQVGGIHVWSLQDGREESQLAVDDTAVTELRFGDGGRTLLAVSQNKVVVLDPISGRQIFVAGDQR